MVLDGVEKAERNVLPVLNNLLENREMALDDGRWGEQANPEGIGLPLYNFTKNYLDSFSSDVTISKLILLTTNCYLKGAILLIWWMKRFILWVRIPL